MRRTWDERDLRQFRAQFLIGVIGYGLILLVILGLIVGLIPEEGAITMWCVGYVVLSLPIATIFLLSGLKKGRDHRPTIMEMFAAGGRS